MKKSVDTIIAVATPPGRGGVAIIRISGPNSFNIAKIISNKSPAPRYATYTEFFSANGEVLDQGLILFFPGPHSFTGEDVVELHGHGGPFVIENIMQRLLELDTRLARPGEFSERAFLNDKIDLVQAEAIADLINASSIKAARSAMHSLQGDFSKKINTLVHSLISLRTFVEAAIDFADEEIEFLHQGQIAQQLTNILQELENIQASAKQGSLLREGITLVIAGRPNVGKSTLLNHLSGKELAIVSDIPGTTRDVLRDQIMIDGLPIHIIDTAGLRESTDVIEQEGIRRAEIEIERADILLQLTDARYPEEYLFPLTQSQTVIIVRNKIDLTQEAPKAIERDHQVIISIAAKTGLGIALLKEQIKKCVGYENNTEGLFSARRRHLDALARAKIFLLNAKTQLENHASELLAEDLRQAQFALNEITGEFTSDDLLGKIFSSFCIGK